MRRAAIGILAAVLAVAPLVRPAAAAPADHLTITTVIANMRAGTMFNLQVVARDPSGVVDTGFNGPISINAAATGGSNFPGGTFTVNASSGSVTVFGMVLNNAANGYTLTASSAGLSNGVSNSFNITARRLMVTSTLTNMKSGTPFGVQVEARDNNNTVAENFTGNISLDAGADGGSNFTGGSQIAAAAGGSATFSGLALADAADGYSITAIASGVSPGFSDTFNVTATHLAVAPVAGSRAGDPFDVTVEARDANDNVAENFTGTVGLDAAATGGSNFAGGTAGVAAAAGTATFVGLALNNAADGYTLSAGSPGLAPSASNGFNVTARQLAVATSVPNVQSGAPFGVTVEARDGNDNIAENFATAINLDASATGGSNLNGGTQNVVATSGVASFSALGLSDAADGYTLDATASGLTGATSNPFNVTASHLSMSSIADVRSGDPFDISISALDANDNVAENFAGTINLDASATGGSNFVGGTAAATAAAGSASFTSLVLNNAADAYTIDADAGGLTGATSNSFDVTASQLSVSAVADVRAGDPFSVSAAARDADGNVAENFTGSVALDASATGGSNFPGGTAGTTASGGTATFDGLVLNDSADGYVLTAGATGLANGASNAFDVTASQLVVTSTIADVHAGTPFTVQVEARDANNVTAENFTASVALDAAATGGANFTGGTQSSAAGGGSATFGNLVLDTAANGYTVTASSPGVNSGTSNSFDVTSGRSDISIGDASIIEGNGGSKNATFTVTLSQAATGTVTVDFTTDSGSASSGTDFVSGAGTVTFAPGETSRTVDVAVKGDLLNEADETFVVNLSGAVNVDIVDGQGVGTIQNDDPLPFVVARTVVALEGSLQPRTAVVTVRLSAPSGQQVAITFQTVDGTAVDGVGEVSADYTARTGTLVFAPGQTQQTVTIALRNDLVVEPDEYFFVELLSPVNALVATPRTVVWVVDDDAPARQLLALGEQVVSLDLDVFRTANLLVDLRLNCGHLQQLVRDVGRYRGSQIAATDADALTAAANRLRVAIGCPV